MAALSYIPSPEEMVSLMAVDGGISSICNGIRMQECASEGLCPSSLKLPLLDCLGATNSSHSLAVSSFVVRVTTKASFRRQMCNRQTTLEVRRRCLSLRDPSFQWRC